ncbi:MAG: mechanosensitive ion channel [Neomegalonema sp.]|nr:mechanosensitive ion channel [Neomegalonema sp.]
MSWAVGFGLSLAGAIVTVVIAYWVAGWVRRAIVRRAERDPRFDQTLAGFFGSVASWAIVALAGVAALNMLGVQTASLIALIGAAGLAVGLALQGTLSNLAAGVMLILFRPFKVGHYVDIAGRAGTVKQIGLFTTELATVDNVQIILPNGSVWGAPITNYSAHGDRRVDLVFGVSYDSDLKTAEAALRAVIEAEAAPKADGAPGRVKDAPAAPFVAVTNLGDSSVDFTVRVWCAAADYWPLRFALIRAVKERFDADGVDIPFPTQTHLVRSEQSS